MQQWNTYRNRAIGCWLQDNGIPTIVDVRWGDERTFPFCCAGAPKNSIIAIGSHGCIKRLQERPYRDSQKDIRMMRWCSFVPTNMRDE